MQVERDLKHAEIQLRKAESRVELLKSLDTFQEILIAELAISAEDLKFVRIKFHDWEDRFEERY